MIRRGSSRWWFRLTALAAVAVIAALALLVYSPWHSHDPLSASVCPYCHFYHVPSEAAAAAVVCLAPPDPAIGPAPGFFSTRICGAPLNSACTRGPPACSPNTQAA